jgi:hypothetical protein
MEPTSAQATRITKETIEIPAVRYDNAHVGEPVALHATLIWRWMSPPTGQVASTSATV